MSIKKVLITGATGFIGTHIVPLCLKDGISVHYLTTRKEKLNAFKGAQGFYWNPAKNEIDVDCLENVDAIVHLAGATVSKRWTKAYKKVILDSRTKTATLLYNTLENNRHIVRSFISASGISIYPNSFTKLYDEENHDINNDFLGMVTAAWESSVDKFKDLGIDVAKIRTGVVFDANEGAFSQLIKPIKMGIASPVGSGNQWMSWIHIDDLARLYLYVITEKLEGIYNAVAPTAVTNKKLTRVVAQHLNVASWLPNVPSFMLKLFLGEMSSLALKGQLVSSKKIQQQGFTFLYANVCEALHSLLPSKKK